MKYICGHYVDREFITYEEKNPEDVFVLDDGLFSVYRYHALFKKPHIVAVTPTLLYEKSEIRPALSSLPEFNMRMSSSVSFNKYYEEGTKSEFMTFDELLVLKEEGWEIVGHSYEHPVVITRFKHVTKPREWHKIFTGVKGTKAEKYAQFGSGLAHEGFLYENGKFKKRTEKEYQEFVDRDTDLLLNWFINKLDIHLDTYVLPFDQASEYLIETLKSKGITRVFGRESKFSYDDPIIIYREDDDRVIYQSER